MLLTVDDWQRVTARPVPEREGRPIVGIDLGAGRAWSAAVGVWRSGRVEAIAVAPGIPDLAAQEKRDRVPAGTYRKLREIGALRVAEGLRVQPPGELMKAVRAEWGGAEVVFCDRFRLAELQDCVNGTSDRAACLAMVGIERGCPRGAQAREGRSAVMRRIVESVAHCKPRVDHREGGRCRQRPAREAGHEQHRARRRRGGAGARVRGALAGAEATPAALGAGRVTATAGRPISRPRLRSNPGSTFGRVPRPPGTLLSCRPLRRGRG